MGFDCQAFVDFGYDSRSQGNISLFFYLVHLLLNNFEINII